MTKTTTPTEASAKAGKPASQRGRYIKYAIGEIILVVIGILIALSINNWNENRKDAAEEQKILANINTEFQSNQIKLESSLSRINISLTSMDSLLHIMNKSISIDDNPNSLDRILQRSITIPKYFPSSMVLKELESSGKLAKLKNNELKSLFYNYNTKLDELKMTVEIGSNSYKDYLDYIKANASLRRLDYIYDDRISQSILSKNNLHLLSDLKFENMLDDHYVLTDETRKVYKAAAEIIKAIIKQTDVSAL